MSLSAPLSYVDRDRVTVGNLPDDPVPVRIFGENGLIGSEVNVTNFPFLVTAQYDSVFLSYNAAGDITQAVYKQAGVTVATLTLTYADGNLVSVVRG